MSTETRIPFDPSRMALNRGGRAYWTQPPEGVRKGSLARVDLETVPGAAPPPARVADAPAVCDTPAEKSTPARSVAEPDPPAAPAPSPTARVEAGLGGVPMPRFDDAEEAPPDGPAEPAPGDTTTGDAPEMGPEVSEVASPRDVDTGPYEPSGALVRGGADIHEMLLNSFVARFPRSYTPEERADVEEAVSKLLTRYGVGTISKHDELIGFGLVTAGAGLARMGPACEGCGWSRNPEGALFCINCGDPMGRGGACVNAAGTFNGRPCPVEGLPVGTKFCPGCGTGQAVGATAHQHAPAPAPAEPRPGARVSTDPPKPTPAAPVEPRSSLVEEVG